MISLKKVIAMARKWKKMAGIGRRTISLPRINHNIRLADRGHFVVYSADKKRFVVPLAYLRSKIFKELFRMSEEEFGIPRDGPLTLPCDAAFMEYVVSVVQKSISLELEKALLESLGSCQSLANSASVSEGLSYRHLILESIV
uniref:Uncharacterized protein n=1 Tax=Quercus lobata TaxID=97700 RepID=A0A7N2KTG0_QUELO